MRSAGIFRSFFAAAAAIAVALLLISILEPLMSFDAPSASPNTIVSTPGAKWTEAMENLPTQAYLWLLFVYSFGSFTAGIICYVVGRAYGLLSYVSVALSLLMLIHLSYTPNPIWFWFVAIVAVGLPVFAPLIIHKMRNIKA